jgi:hypothetical protein
VRITITLHEDVVRLVEAKIEQSGSSLDEIVNQALRRSLGGWGLAGSLQPYRVRPHKAALRPGVDHRRFNALADKLEDQAIGLAKTRPKKAR